MIWKTGHNKKLSNITGMSVYRLVTACLECLKS